VTFVNSSFFLIPLLPILSLEYRKHPEQFTELWDAIRALTSRYTRLTDSPEDVDTPPDDQGKPSDDADQKLTLLQTATLSLEFSGLWFTANYFAAACLEYTTVGSATILTSTSSVWTLLFGALARVERFTLRKLLGVAASLAGLALVSGLDAAGSGGGSGDARPPGAFPHKTARELAVGDALALVGAVAYGVYAVVLKKRIGSEARANLPLFFGLVGLFNALAMWPAFLFLHVTGIEPFELPPTRRVLAIVLVNSAGSMVSDFCWAAAMLLTSPLLVTVGLSLTIPLSLVGQMFISGVYAGFAYWAGAAVVLCSFVFINHEETKDEGPTPPSPMAMEGEAGLDH
jgi:solute carrier family 35 protein F5